MSTRGFIGFRTTSDKKTLDNVYGVYSHSDSYYSGVGIDVLNIYMDNDKESLNNLFNEINWIDEDDECYCDIIDYLKGYEKNVTFFNDRNFLIDGLSCEYAYVINLESDSLEVYRGFFNEGQYEGQGSFKSHTGNEYFVNKVFEVNRESDFNKVRCIFSETRCMDYEDIPYFEEKILNGELKI